MIEALCFTLAAPIGSFGSIAGNARRGTLERPGHSLIVGLLGAALGLDRQDERLLALSEGSRVAVAMAGTGPLLRDYHTVQSAKARKGVRPPTRRQALAQAEPYTTVTERDYLTDIRATVALARVEGPFTLAEMAQALERPRFTLYLGRKSCPLALPLAPEIVAAERVDEALRAYEDRQAARLRALWPIPQIRAERGIAVDARLYPGAHGQRRRLRAAVEDRAAWRYRLLDELVLTPPPGAGGAS